MEKEDVVIRFEKKRVKICSVENDILILVSSVGGKVKTVVPLFSRLCLIFKFKVINHKNSHLGAL